MVSVFNYTDFRVFLAEWIAKQRLRSRIFSLRGFSRRAGFGSHASLHLILNGKRNLPAKGVPSLAKALGLKPKEARFFSDLVAFTQSASLHERHHYYERLIRHAKFRRAHEPGRHQLEYFSRWYYVAIREMVSLPDFREEPQWIVERLKGAISEKEAAAAIKTLLKLNLCSRDADGRLEPSCRSIATSDEVASMAVAAYHEGMTGRAAKALKEDPLKELHFSALTVPISGKTFEKVKERLNEFRRELRAILEDDDHPEEIGQINLQLVKLTRRVA